ncbi:hypothetical protein C8R44DRAFT_725231 [Mycena epipterygia]|nr:hypothetical protein C8R44DRAFT_725231 [Mycena epipterygia]
MSDLNEETQNNAEHPLTKKPNDTVIETRWSLPNSMSHKLDELQQLAEAPKDQIFLTQLRMADMQRQQFDTLRLGIHGNSRLRRCSECERIDDSDVVYGAPRASVHVKACNPGLNTQRPDKYRTLITRAHLFWGPHKHRLGGAQERICCSSSGISSETNADLARSIRG